MNGATGKAAGALKKGIFAPLTTARGAKAQKHYPVRTGPCQYGKSLRAEENSGFPGGEEGRKPAVGQAGQRRRLRKRHNWAYL
jgi:hypothetical protein